jgi:hypothetical protein
MYTTFPQNAPQIVNRSGGPVVAEPRLIAVTFDGDAARADLETFISTIGATDYWRHTSAEYGVAAATSGTPVHLSESAPASLSLQEARAWLAAHLDGTHPEWGTPDDHSFYVVFFPATTTLTLEGLQRCTGFGGYHDAATLPNGQHVVFAAMPRCETFNGLTGFDILGAATSHELLEGVTDPLSDHPAYPTPDSDHIAWMIETSGEVDDLCAAVPCANTHVPGFPYMVQRTWSNAEAAAGRDPCVPHVSPQPYVVAAPVVGHVGQGTDASLGVQIAVGESKTLEVDVSSGGPTDAPIMLKAIDGATMKGRPANLDFSWDRTTARNGDRVHLTVKRTALDAAGYTTLIVGAYSDLTNAALWHVIVTN